METDERPVANDARTVSIEKMVFGGEGLARTPEGVVLVPLVVPGEEVSITIDEMSKGVRRGSVVEITRPSPDRIPASCPVFAQCGGCQYQHVGYEKQVEFKTEILRESFERIGKVKIDVPVTALASEPFGYRNRVRLRVGNDDAGFRMGYFGLESHSLVAINECPIASPAINSAIARLLSGIGADCFPEGEAELEIFSADAENVLLLTVYSELPPPHDFGEKLRSQLQDVASVEWRHDSRERRTAGFLMRTETWGPGFISYRVGDRPYRVSHDSFFQANRHLVEKMIEVAVDDLKGNRALDLYAGVGLFSVPLASRFEKVAAVESQPSAAQDLQWNLKSSGKAAVDHARGFEMTVDRFLSKAAANWDAIILDPPRGGLNRLVVEDLIRIRAPRVVYLSCDPTTLARDTAVLVRSGYRIRSAHLIDQFPQTFHIESLLHLELG